MHFAVFRTGVLPILLQRTGAIVIFPLPAYHHSFTHFDLTLHPIVVRVADAPRFVADSDRHVWYDLRQPAKIGLAKPAVDLIRQLAAEPPLIYSSGLLDF